MTHPLPTSGQQQFANEEVKSRYGYPTGYRLRCISEQANILRAMFAGVGNIDPDYLSRIKRGEIALPAGAERWFAIPRWQNLATTYNEALDKVLAMLASTRPFKNWRAGQLGPDRLRQSGRAIHALDLLAEQQNGADILIVPAQFGQRHAGRSVRRAREVFTANEFGLGAYEVGIMLLTHPERLVSHENLWPDCPGDEYAVDDGRFVLAPYFRFGGGQLGFDSGWSVFADADFGSASGFLPQ